MAKKRAAKKKADQAANLGFEARLWLAGDKLRNNMDAAEYKAENCFWVPTEARWHTLEDSAKQATIGKLIDDAMVAIERDNPRLKGVLPKDYARPALDKQRLGELIDLIGTIAQVDADNRYKDLQGLSTTPAAVRRECSCRAKSSSKSTVGEEVARFGSAIAFECPAWNIPSAWSDAACRTQNS